MTCFLWQQSPTLDTCSRMRQISTMQVGCMLKMVHIQHMNDWLHFRPCSGKHCPPAAAAAAYKQMPLPKRPVAQVDGSMLSMQLCFGTIQSNADQGGTWVFCFQTVTSDSNMLYLQDALCCTMLSCSSSGRIMPHSRQDTGQPLLLIQ